MKTSIIGDIGQDLRYGLRMLWKNPGFTSVAVLALALGIGANSAIFSVVNTVLLQSLPYQNPEQLVMFWENSTHLGFPKDTPSPANFLDWQRQSTVFIGMAAMAPKELQPHRRRRTGTARWPARLGQSLRLVRRAAPTRPRISAGGRYSPEHTS